MYFYGGYVGEDGEWNTMTKDQYPTLDKAYVSVKAPSDVTTVTTVSGDPTDTTTSVEPTGTTTSAEPTGTTTSAQPSGDDLLGDVNGDGQVKSNDLLQLKKYLLGLVDF